MKILVCVKQVPDTTAKLAVAANALGIDEKGFKWVMNPYDEFAVEEALLIKQKNPAAMISVLSVGPKARVVEAIRTALAMGADDGIVIDADATVDSYACAKLIAAACEKEGGFNLILCGKMAIDASQAATTQMIAQQLKISHANIVSKMEIAGDKINVERDLSGGSKEQSSLPLMSVIGANKGLNTPRYASLPGIMKAKKKPLKEYSSADLGLSDKDSKLKYFDYRLPADRAAVQMISGDSSTSSANLVKLLREEAKVI